MRSERTRTMLLGFVVGTVTIVGMLLSGLAWLDRRNTRRNEQIRGQCAAFGADAAGQAVESELRHDELARTMKRVEEGVVAAVEVFRSQERTFRPDSPPAVRRGT